MAISLNKIDNIKAAAANAEAKVLKTHSSTTINLLTGEITPGYNSGSRDVSYIVNISCDDCDGPDGTAFEGTFDTSTSDITIIGIIDGSNICGNVVGVSSELGSTLPSADACADAGDPCDVYDCDGACAHQRILCSQQSASMQTHPDIPPPELSFLLDLMEFHGILSI